MKLKKTKEKAEFIEEIREEKTFSSLDEVMDYNRDFSIIYSGVENETYFDGCYKMGVRNFLMSFHYLQNSKKSFETRFKDYSNIKLFIDSGAHTYQNDPKYEDFGVDYWEKHLQRYLKWVEKNRDYIFAIASFDFENLVGAEKVLEWNQKYLEPFMLRTGIPVCFVWHQNSARTWEYYCKRYPYVGFSSVNTEGQGIEFNEYVEKLKVAEHNNALVHGFGMTRTSLLPKLPFYTVDSTSWKAGFMYGQLAFWNGKKVQMVRKEDFDSKAFKYTRQYSIQPPLDEKLLHDYYEPEVLRANVYAYQRAEEYINNSLKSRMYWKKPKGIKRTEESLKSLIYPTEEWLMHINEMNDWENYARSFNVSTAEKSIALDCISDITVLMNWGKEEYRNITHEIYNSDMVSKIHDVWINRIVDSEEQRIKDLQSFFKDNLLGINNTLLMIGTNFDRIVKERESYIEENYVEYEDIPDDELNIRLSKLLPIPKEGETAPEIDELDDEIFEEVGIIPVRDSQGRFLKGQKQVLKPKKMYSHKYPKMACDTCFNAQKCPEYKAGYVCAFNHMFDRFDTRNSGDIIQAMQGIVDFSLQRLQRGMITEVMNGGMPDPNVTGMMNQSMGYLNQLNSLYNSVNKQVLRQTRVINSDGSEEYTTQVTNPQSGGILEKIFGGLTEDKKEEPNKDGDNTKQVIEVQAEVVE